MSAALSKEQLDEVSILLIYGYYKRADFYSITYFFIVSTFCIVIYKLIL